MSTNPTKVNAYYKGASHSADVLITVRRDHTVLRVLLVLPVGVMLSFAILLRTAASAVASGLHVDEFRPDLFCIMRH